MGNISVVIQQPTALMRAMAMISPEYFLGKARVSDYRDMMEHAPVAMIKKMGKFDTGMGQTAVEYLMNEEKTLDQKAADLLGIGAEFADMVTWTNIWNACKRETRAKHKNVEYGSDEFYRITYKRFRDVVDYTQVYDSTLSKSELMRGPGSMTKMVTAFMGEPTLSYNMLTQSGMHKNGRTINKGRAIAAFVANIVVNSALKSLVGAWRDRDEDETFLERYFKRLTGDLVGSKSVLFIDGAWSPFGMIPWVKDVVSLMQGYSVDRSDVSVVSDILGAGQNLIETAKDYDGHFGQPEIYALMDLAGEISKLTNIPLAQVVKDVKGIINHVTYDLNHPMKTTFETARQAIREGLGYRLKDAEKAYDAVLRNDTEYIRRLLVPDDEKIKGYLDDGNTPEQAYENANVDAKKNWETDVQNGILAKDERAVQAAEARYEGRLQTYENLVADMEADGLPHNSVIGAIKKLYDELWPAEPEEKTIKDKTLYTTKDLERALENNDVEAWRHIKDELLIDGVSESSIKTKATDYAKELIADGDAESAKRVLVTYAGMSKTTAAAKVDTWQHPDGLSESAWVKYYDKIADTGISKDVYREYVTGAAECEGEDKNGDGKADSGTKKEQILKVIDSLPITKEQKDALYRLNTNWAESKLKEAPWHK
jgi:hypothetical protein